MNLNQFNSQTIASSYVDEGEVFLKSQDNLEISKGRTGKPLGSKETWGGKEYIKTAGGWKPVGKNGGAAKAAHDYVHGEKKYNNRAFKVNDNGTVEAQRFTIPNEKVEEVSKKLSDLKIEHFMSESDQLKGMTRLFADHEHKENIRTALKQMGGDNEMQAGHFPFGLTNQKQNTEEAIKTIEPKLSAKSKRYVEILNSTYAQQTTDKDRNELIEKTKSSIKNTDSGGSVKQLKMDKDLYAASKEFLKLHDKMEKSENEYSVNDFNKAQAQRILSCYSDTNINKSIDYKSAIAEMKNRRDPDNLEKSGEGSKGGKVIGHTKSGKAIYQNPNHESHKKFTSADHTDASEIHMTSKESTLNNNERDEASADHSRKTDEYKRDLENRKKAAKK